MSTNGIIAAIIEEEGGWVYTDHPDDPDQGTYAGVRYITWANYMSKHNSQYECTPEIFQRLAYNKHNILRADVLAIYKEEYWDAMSLYNIPMSFQQMIMSCGVNIGVQRAREFMQKAANKCVLPSLHLTVDGIIGPKTIKVFNENLRYVGVAYRRHFVDIWMAYYIELVHLNARAWRAAAQYDGGKPADPRHRRLPTTLRATFMQGWYNRAIKYRS